MNEKRNLNPTPEAVFAMFHWHVEYSICKAGSMDFYDSRTNEQKKFCERAVEALKEKIK